MKGRVDVCNGRPKTGAWIGHDCGMPAAELVLIANAGDATITTFTLVDDQLLPLTTTQLPGACSTFAIDEDANLVYAFAKGEPPMILTLRLDRTTGQLTEVQRAKASAAMVYLTLAHSGTLLLGASYHGGVGLVWPVKDGVLGEPVSTIEYPNLHCVITSSDSNNAYFVSLGDDLVAQYGLASDGKLSPLDPPTVEAPKGSGTRHLVLSGDEKHAYLVTEYSGVVFGLSRDEDGRLSIVDSASIVDESAGLSHSRFGADPRAEHLIWGADVHPARDGSFLLATERSASTIASLHLNNDGKLGQHTAIRETEPQPRGFIVTPGGDRALVVGERSTTVTLYAIGDDGVLFELDRKETGRGANWVRVLA